MKVSIGTPRVVGMKKIYDTPEQPTTTITPKKHCPRRYNEATELTIKVKIGINQHDFPLMSQ